MIEITSTHMIEVPVDYTVDDITYYLNESSHCLENELEKMLDHPKDTCDTCWRANAKYIGEATENEIYRFTKRKNK